MGFIPSGSTVSVTAYLTDKGREKLYNSIESNSSGFITKFTLGDSDTQYSIIDSVGAGILSTGQVPEASEFKPGIRSNILYKGRFRPGKPVILIEDQVPVAGDVWKTIAVGGPEAMSFTFTIRTEWPKNTPYAEQYRVEMTPDGGQITQKEFNSLFSITPIGGAQYRFNFLGTNDGVQFEKLFGINYNGFTTVSTVITGKDSNIKARFNVNVTK